MTILDLPPALESRDEPGHPVHVHAWSTESVHATSEGHVRYRRCTDCDVRRVELQPHASSTSGIMSRDVPPR